MEATGQGPTRRRPLAREDRERVVLDVAAELFYAHGVRAVGMDALIARTGLAKMSVYRVFPTKDDLVGAYLRRLSARILTLVDADIGAAPDPASAVLAVLAAVETDIGRTGFRGCPFANAAVDYAEDDHPARVEARAYREALLGRFVALLGTRRGRQVAALVDGAYLSAAHLGPHGPAAEALSLARSLAATAPDIATVPA